MKLPRKRIVAFLLSVALVLSIIPFSTTLAASPNSVALTLYNDSEGSSSPVPYDTSYVWKASENRSNVFRLVVDMSFAQLYNAGEIELTIDAFSKAGRGKPIIRKSFGNEAGVFKETSTETFNSGIVAENTASINGSASISITYQIKPEDIKDLGTLNSPITLMCTLKAGSETVTSNKISFTTDFTQSWSIINSGDHDEAYDEIGVYKVNENAPLIHQDRLVTIDGTAVTAATVSSSPYYWVEYRVPLLSDDPLGIYNHYIEIGLPDGCVFYSAQCEYEDNEVTPPDNLSFSINKNSNTVTVDCADYINKPHSADTTDSYYHFVIALDKSKHSNTDVVTFKEKHVHKDSSSIVAYSENTESADQSLSGWNQFSPKFTVTTKFNNGIAKEDFSDNYKRSTTAISYSLPVTSEMKIKSVVPFMTKTVGSSSKITLATSEYDISSVYVPAHYLNDNGEVVYGVNYSVHASSDGVNYNVIKSGSISSDITVTLPDDMNYAYVIYSPKDKTLSKEFYTYGSGDYAYKVSPTFEYEFFVSDNTASSMDSGTVSFAGISATGEDVANPVVVSSITNYIPLEELERLYRLSSEQEASVVFSGNHYEVTPVHTIDYFANSTLKSFSKFKIVSVIPSNYYGNSADSVEALLNKVKKSVLFYNVDESGNSTPFYIEKKDSDGKVVSKSVTSENILDYVTVSVTENTDGSLKAVFDVDFGDYTINVNKGSFAIASFKFSYTWPMARLNETELGSKKTFDMISVMYSDTTESILPDIHENNFRKGSYYFTSADNGTFAESVSSASILSSSLSDADSDGNTAEQAYFTKTNISILDTGETAQSTNIAVETEYTPLSFTTYANPAITMSDREYTLALSFEGYSSSYSELVFVTNLGNHENDLSDWLGTFKAFDSVTTNFTDNIVFDVYYSADTIDVSSELERIKTEHNMNSTEFFSWLPIEDCIDYSKVKAISVVVKSTDGTIVKDDTVTAYIKMLSNDSVDYDNLFNRVNFGCVAFSNVGDTISTTVSDYVVIKQFNPRITYIKRIKADSVNLANGTPTFIVECGNNEAGTSFVFSFDKGYDIVEIDGVEYYELKHEITNELDFSQYKTTEKDSLRYGSPYITVSDGDGNVSGSVVSFETSFSNPEITIISVSEKEIYGGLSHNALCINTFDNKVE